MNKKLTFSFSKYSKTIELNWSRVGFIIWDLNGTLAPEDPAAAEITEHATLMLFREFFKDQGLHLGVEEISALCENVLSGKNPADHPLFEYGRAQGIDMGALSHPYYANLHQDIMIDLAHMYDAPAYCKDTARSMAHFSPIRRQFVMTHATENWIRYVLERMKLPGLHDSSRIYSIRDLPGRKDERPEAYEHICAQHGLDPSDGLVVDNDISKLAMAASAGCQVVLIDPERKTENHIPSFLSAVFKDIRHLAQHFQIYLTHLPEDFPDKQEINRRDPELLNLPGWVA